LQNVTHGINDWGLDQERYTACPGQYATESLAAYPPAKRNSFSEVKGAAAQGQSGGWLAGKSVGKEERERGKRGRRGVEVPAVFSIRTYPLVS